MPGPQPPSRQSSVSSNGNRSTIDAALVGAATAFGRPAVHRTPSNISLARGSNGGGHGSLAAAATVGRDQQRSHRTPSRSPLPPPTRSPAGSVSSVSRYDGTMLDLSRMPTLSAHQQAPSASHGKSASQQAALLAASRARPAPPAVRPAVAPKPRRLSGQHGRVESDKPTDTTSIPPTTSLVNLFEQKASATASTPAKRPDSIAIKPSREPPVKSPKPVRSGLTSMFQLELGDNNGLDKSQRSAIPHLVSSDGSTRSRGPHLSRDRGPRRSNSSEDSYASASEDLDAGSPRAVMIPENTRVQVPSPSLGSDLPTQTQKTQNQTERRSISVSPLRNTVSKPVLIKRSSAASHEPFPISSAVSTKSIHAQYKQAYPHPGRMTPLTTGDQLANALVASSLASSRAPSPTRLEPPPIPTRRRRNPHHHHNVLGFSRTPSPAKAGMLHTLRPQDSSSDSESDAELHPYGKHKKKRLVRKHPNKHHEGDRKRWRDAVTERERKRYEGVWAANKGIQCSFTLQEERIFRQAPDGERMLEIQSAAKDQVSNIVARDIWNRSRLPEATLETVWDLVDHDAVGRLSREEFVVGMWLIDQRLKGRKLPVKVTESVWASVRSLQGIKIRK